MTMTEAASQQPHLKLDTVGSRIRAVLEARRLNVSKAAKLSKVSRTTFSCWVNEATLPSRKRLGDFAKLTEVSLEWLMARQGPDPEMVIPVDGRTMGLESGDAAIIPEISGSMAAHAEKLDLNAQSVWTMPPTVVQLGFNAEPNNLVVQRCVATDRMVERGDYLLIDHTRNKFDDAGCYIVTRENAGAAFRVELEWERGELVLRDQVIEDWQTLKVLGRVMGFLRPT